MADWKSFEEQVRSLLDRGPDLGAKNRLLKSAVLRVLRVYTRSQDEVNRALLHGVRALAEQVQSFESMMSERLRAERNEALKQLSAEIAGVRQENQASVAKLSERMEWLVGWTDQFRKELFFEVRHRLEEQERLTKPEVMDRQKYQAKVQRMENGLRVNLGAGHIPRGEYVNVDQRAIDGVDVRADVRHLPFEENSIGELYCAHLIEHFPEAEMRSRILPYWHKLLRPGGKLVVVCPDAEAMMRGWADGKMPYDDLREVTFGGQEYQGNTHFNMFTPDSLERLLKEVSFREVRRIAVARPNGKCLEMELEGVK